MPFELLDPTEATLVTVTNRTETHGEERVPAISFGLRFIAPNAILDRLSPTLRHTLYMRDDEQQDLPGVEDVTPILRSRDIELVTVPGCIEGAVVKIQHGIDEDDPIAMGECKVHKYKVEPYDIDRAKGFVAVSCLVSTADIGAGDAGLLWSKQQQQVFVTIEPPKASAGDGPQLPAGQVIDGTSGHPGAGPLFDHDPEDGDADSEGGELDATDAFVAQHGGGEPERGKKWPFPKPPADDEREEAAA